MNETTDNSRWNDIAWNGIAFRKPACWDIVTLGRNYLMLGTRTAPSMEITWGNPSRSASQQSLKQLQAKIGKKQGMSANAWNLPQSWLDALAGHKAGGFSCCNPAGKALIVSCLSCNRTALLQFYQSSNDNFFPFQETVTRILSSFRDHPVNSRQQWSVFDIRAVLPAAFQISSYQFSPGFMAMDFSMTGINLSLYRWSPASVLLVGKILSEFAGALPFYPGSAAEIRRDANRIEWAKSPSDGMKDRLMTFFSAGYAHHRFMIRHACETNRILAVRSESRHPVDYTLFEQVVADYEITTT